MPSAEELEQLLEAKEHLDPYEISRLMEMEAAQKNDPWEVEHGDEQGATGLG